MLKDQHKKEKEGGQVGGWKEGKSGSKKRENVIGQMNECTGGQIGGHREPR